MGHEAEGPRLRGMARYNKGRRELDFLILVDNRHHRRRVPHVTHDDTTSEGRCAQAPGP